MIYSDYLRTLNNYLRSEGGASVVDVALESLGFGFDPTLRQGIMCACALGFPWCIYATPGWDGAIVDDDCTIVPVQILDDEATSHPTLGYIDAFRLRLTGFVEADAILYAAALCKVVKEVVKHAKPVAV